MIILAFFLSFVYLQVLDYYQILGVQKNSTLQEIKKAYRSLALNYHPDKIKNQQDQENSSQKFSDLTEAFEILSDEDQKAIYDIYGDKKHFTEPQDSHLKKTDFYLNSDIITITDQNFQQYTSKKIVIEFYTPWCIHCQNMIKEYKKFGLLMQNEQTQVGAINCQTYQHLCQMQNVNAYPTLRYYHNSKFSQLNYQQDAYQLFKSYKESLSQPMHQQSNLNTKVQTYTKELDFKHILNQNNALMVLFSSSINCIECPKVESTAFQLQQELSEYSDVFKIIVVDCLQINCQQYQLQRYPQLKLFKLGNKNNYIGEFIDHLQNAERMETFQEKNMVRAAIFMRLLFPTGKQEEINTYVDL